MTRSGTSPRATRASPTRRTRASTPAARPIGAGAAFSSNEVSDSGSGPGVDQAVQLEDAIHLSYCQPFVGAYFNFHLVDEKDLGGWQSGVYYPDGTPKTAYQALHRTAGEVNASSINCAAPLPTACRRVGAAFNEVGAPLKLTNLKTRLARLVRRDAHLADARRRPRRVSPTASPTSASRRRGRPSASPAATHPRSPADRRSTPPPHTASGCAPSPTTAGGDGATLDLTDARHDRQPEGQRWAARTARSCSTASPSSR